MNKRIVDLNDYDKEPFLFRKKAKEIVAYMSSSEVSDVYIADRKEQVTISVKEGNKKIEKDHLDRRVWREGVLERLMILTGLSKDKTTFYVSYQGKNYKLKITKERSDIHIYREL